MNQSICDIYLLILKHGNKLWMSRERNIMTRNNLSWILVFRVNRILDFIERGNFVFSSVPRDVPCENDDDE